MYAKACEVAEGKGIIIADTKLEFGIFGSEVILIDEVLTPDSSRFLAQERLPSGCGAEELRQTVRAGLSAVAQMEPEGPGACVARRSGEEDERKVSRSALAAHVVTVYS